MKKFFGILGLAIFLFVSSGSVFAGILDIKLTVGGETYSESFNTVKDLMNGIDEDFVKKHFPAYNDSTPLVAEMNFRGVKIEASFDGTKKLTLKIPSIGVDEVFDGATREDSQKAMEDWFKKNGKEKLTELMQAFAKSTPNDPIAGNPNSLMATMVHMDFDQAFTSNASNLRPIRVANIDRTGRNSNLITFGGTYSSYRQDGADNKKILVPLTYTWRFDNTRNKLRFRLPVVAVQNIEGSKAFNLGAGLAFGWQVTDAWELTPAASYGAAGSIDLGSVGQIASGSLTSSYKIPFGDVQFGIGNMLGYYKTLKFATGEYSFDPDIKSTVLKNGVMLSVPTSTWLHTPSWFRNTVLELFVSDTRYFGTELFIDQYNEIGFAFGYNNTTTTKGKNYLTDFRLGLSYLFCDKSKGFSASFSWSF